MFKGYVLSESLKDPRTLNAFKQEYVIVEKHSESKLKFWHDFKLNVSDKKMSGAARVLSKTIKYRWYAHFWNTGTVYMVLPGRVFKMKRQKNGDWRSTSMWKDCLEYATKYAKVERRYLGFGPKELK